ncbi:MAPEG family protein [Candidatus Synechococcus calcipolaris G9]|uniref:MAPEG family protein n=1 Tax=Candidatus Synechococcus calcipolaris G9 TaxID=1497997 RepID=A0ABT6F0L8_9SYNE|nr:MAPEG family protein [Candidatus Synechococcus calcipolaris]MDG2991343.1 MAPEG family protein [Candidatus Synechococcus calcipolaris G9]
MDLNVSWLLGCSLLVATILIYFPYCFVVAGRVQAGFDPAAPRALFDKLPPYAQRATWAHENSFETFMPYAAAVLLALVTGVQTQTAAIAAVAFIGARFLFSICYIANIPLGRSLMFGISTAATLTLFVQSLQVL